VFATSRRRRRRRRVSMPDLAAVPWPFVLDD